MERIIPVYFVFSLIVTQLVACGGGGSNDNNTQTNSNIPACGSGDLFSARPLNIGDYSYIAPLGNLNPPGHTYPTMHHYFYITNSDGIGAPDVVPVFSPGDVYITQISTSEHLSASPVFTDYGITFKPCTEYKAFFGHVQSINTELQNQLNRVTPSCNTYSTGGEDFRYCSYSLEYFVSAGTQLGTTGGRDGQFALDFGARDLRLPALQWANQNRWQISAGDGVYTACPSDAFEATLKAELETGFTDYLGNPRTVAPVCGNIAQDIAASAQGVWFREGVSDFYPEDPHIALVHDNFDPNFGVLSLGTSLTISGAFRYTPTHNGFIDREFSEVIADNNIYCYNLSSGAKILLRLTSDTRMEVEHQAGNCSLTPYSFNNAVAFIR